MTINEANNQFDSELLEVKDLMLAQLSRSTLQQLCGKPETLMGGGKMLRARLTISLARDIPKKQRLARAAGIELLHAASLLHDDVIDGASLRRYAPTFWNAHGRSGAILFGDTLLFFAMRLFNASMPTQLSSEVIELAGTMCQAEVNQELLSRKQPQTWDEVTATARNKTGALFACAAVVATSGTCNEELEVLREAGFLLGTAYQLSDDFQDVHGSNKDCGKTLGLDAQRAKNTAVNAAGTDQIKQSISDLLTDSTALLTAFPKMKKRWTAFVEEVIALELRSQMVL